MQRLSDEGGAIAVAVALLLTSINVSAYAESGEEAATEATEQIASEATEPMSSDVMEQASSDLTEQVSEEKTEQSENNISDNTADDQQDSEGILPVDVPESLLDEVPSKKDVKEEAKAGADALSGAFSESISVDGVKITIEADAGVFPDEAYAEARKVSADEANRVEEAVEDVRNEEKNVAASYTFDITIFDKDGNEIEPDKEKGSVRVTFEMEEVSNTNLETEVYHVEETDSGLDATALEVEEVDGNEDAVVVETEGFSYYTVDFTYGELKYVLDGGSQVTLKEILDYLGIEGEVKDAVFSNPELVDVSMNEDGEWIVTSLKSFTTDEKLIVTIGGIDFDIDFVEIDVTDPFYFASVDSFAAVLNQSGQVTKYKIGAQYTETVGVKERCFCLLFVPEEKEKAVADTKFRVKFADGQAWTIYYRYPGGVDGANAYPHNSNGVVQSDYPYASVNGILSEYFKITTAKTTTSISKEITKFYNNATLNQNTSYSVFVIGLMDLDKNNTFYNINGQEDATTKAATLLRLPITLKKEDPNNLGSYITISTTNTHFVEGGTITYDTWPAANVAGTGYSINTSKSTGAGTCKSQSGSSSSSNRQANPVTICYDLNRYKVSFNLNNGSGTTPSTQSIAYGTKAAVPTTPEPTRAGYDFVGWSTSSTATTANISSTTIKTATTFYAVWKAHTEHTWNHAAGTGSTANTLYAYCSANTGCANYGTASDMSKAVQISVVAPTNKVYTGSSINATISGNSTQWTGTGATWPTISYEYKASSSGTYASTTDTSRVGWYRASITSANKTASVEYEIIKATRNVSASVAGWTYGQSGSVPAPKLSAALPDDPAVTYYYNTTGNNTSGTAWSNISDTKGLNAGTYYVYASIVATDSYNAYTTAASQFIVSKANCVVTPPTGKTDLKYTGNAQELLATPGSVVGGTMNYSTAKDGTYSTSIPTGTDAGTYSVWYKGIGDANHEDSTPVEIKVSIAKVPCEVTAPTALNLTYTGGPQALVNAGSVGSGATKVQYSSDQNGTYADTIPTGTNAGQYSVWYKGIGDSNHEDSTPQEVKVTIAKADCSYTAPKGKENLKYTGSAQELAEAGSTSDGTIYYRLKKTEDYSTDVPKGTAKGEYTVWYKIVGDSNHNDVEPQSITVVIDRNVRATITVLMDDYTYEQTTSLPTPITSPAKDELYETPDITYFYNTTESNEGGEEWKNIDSTTLSAGTYYMYAVVKQTDSYLEYKTAAKAFNVNKSTTYAVEPPIGKLTYGQKLSEATFEGGSAEKQGTFDWADSVKGEMPDATAPGSDPAEYEMVFTPSGDDAINYAPVTVPAKVIVAPKKANPEISNIKVTVNPDDTVTVTETVKEAEGELTEGKDYEKTVNKEPEKPGDTSTNYTITYTFIGNYTGTVTKKVSIPKAQKPGDNIVSTAESDPKAEEEYKPDIKPVSYDDAKKLINDEIGKMAEKSEDPVEKGKAQAIVDILGTPEENDIVYDAELSVEMKALESAPVDDAAKVEEEAANIPRVNKDDIRYIDISVFLTYTAQIGDDAATKVIQSKEPIHDMSEIDVKETIAISVPVDLRKVPSGYERTYYVIRAHKNNDGEIETTKLAQTKSTTITIKSDKFSTYALLYSDSLKPVVPDDPDEPSGSSNGNSTIVASTVPVMPVIGMGYVSPKTGDTKELYVLIGLLLIGAAVIIRGRRKKI